MTTPSHGSGLLATLKTLLTAFPPEGPVYCLIGALALGAWGRVRATHDIDLLLLLDEEQTQRLIDFLEPLGFSFDIDWANRNPMAQGRVTRLRHSGYPVDLISAQDDHERETLARRSSLILEDVSAWICTAEDLVLLKLKACRDQDLVDAQSVIHRQRVGLDRDYLWKWAGRLGLQGELHHVFQMQPP
jgi:hypothetical protein